MPSIKNNTLLYIAKPSGNFEPGVHTKYVEEEIDLDTVPLNGGVLIKTIALSSDPYILYRTLGPKMPSFCQPLDIGSSIDTYGVGKILRSENPDFTENDICVGWMEAKEYSVYPQLRHYMLDGLTKIHRHPGLPLSYYVGVFSICGGSAYCGFKGLALEKAKTSKTMFISSGAGAVGSAVVGYARYLAPHLKIIASAGSQYKVDILKSLGVDVAINYKTEDVSKILQENGPIDIYWDNTSGANLDAALDNMNWNGLIVAGGAISGASTNGKGSAIMNFEKIFQRDLTVKGFLYGTGETAPLIASFHEEFIPLVASQKITVREHRYPLSKGGEALRDVHTGANLGKSIIIVSEEDL